MSNLFANDIFRKKKGRVSKILSDREKARGIINNTPEAVIKLDKASICTKKHMLKAACYQARNGKLEMEDDKGNLLSLDDIKEKIEDWCDDQDVPENDEDLKNRNEKRAADARRMIISCPTGTDHNKLRNVARDFANEFLKKEGFEYMFVLHAKTDETPKEPEHPHVHFIIKAISSKEKRLNIRKADLKLMRERFATIAKEYGIDLNATSRAVRCQVFKSKSQVLIHQEKRNKKNKFEEIKDKEIIEALKNNTTLKDHPILTKAKNTRQLVLKNVKDFITELNATCKKEDIELAKKLKEKYTELAKHSIESKQQLKYRIAKRIANERKKQQTQAQKWAIERKKQQIRKNNDIER